MSMIPAELKDWMSERGQSVYRANQVFGWLHDKRADAFDAMTNLPLKLREQLAAECEITCAEVVCRQLSADGTVKYLLAFKDGNGVEAVAMRYRDGLSVCLSTQAGCAMGCTFCASTVDGKARDLVASEMLAQLYRVEAEEGQRATGVVLMGVGEPLDNFDHVMRFCDLVTDPCGSNLAGRALTISTCGIVPRIYELAEQKRQLTLAVSLHAADDAARSALMPINRKYPLTQLMAACRFYFERTGRRVTFEYAVIRGQNDRPSDADAVARLLTGMGAHVNLIPANPTRDAVFGASRQEAEAFAALLTARGLHVTVRRTLGADIDAACGQLRRAVKTGNL